MKAPALSLICDHSGSAFGSNTAHCRPRRRLSSMNRVVRRTEMYLFSSASWLAQAGEEERRVLAARADEVLLRVEELALRGRLVDPVARRVDEQEGAPDLAVGGRLRDQRRLDVVARCIGRDDEQVEEVGTLQ